MTRPSALTLTAMTPQHIDAARRLSQAAGWLHRREDWALLLSLGEGLVVTDDAGDDGARVLGTAIRADFGPVSVANMVLVDAELRGRGMGRQLFEALLSRAPDATWRLVATNDGLPLYRSLGFVETGFVRQYQGVVPDGYNPPSDAEWVTPDAALRAQIIAMDQDAGSATRAAFFAAIEAQARIAVLRGVDGLQGFGVLRPFGHGHVLAPLIARDASAAAQILRFVAGSMAGRFLRIDTLSPPGGACPLATPVMDAGLGLVGTGIDMIRPPSSGGPPAHRPDPHRKYHRFGLAAQALG